MVIIIVLKSGGLYQDPYICILVELLYNAQDCIACFEF